jgi:hypothetical protein
LAASALGPVEPLINSDGRAHQARRLPGESLTVFMMSVSRCHVMSGKLAWGGCWVDRHVEGIHQ